MTPLLNLNSNNDSDFITAIKYVYELNRSDLVSLLHQRGAGSSAEDLYQEAFLVLISRKGKTNFNLKNGMASIKKYLEVIMLRQLYKKKEKIAKIKVAELAYDTQRYSISFSFLEDRSYPEEFLRTIIGKLSPLDKYLYYLFFEEAYSNREIARELCVNPVTARVRIVRLKRKLREALVQ